MSETESRPGLLVVDDEPQILTAVEDLLEEDFRIFTAPDGVAALDVLAKEDIWVILSDQRMPGMSGDEFLNHARRRSEATRVLITGYTDISALVRAVNVGQIHAYVSKPWNPVELRTILLNAARQFQLLRDISHQRRLLTALMESLPDAIYFLDGDLRYERVNPAHARLLGLESPEAAVGRTAGELLPPDQAAALERDDRRLMETGEPLVDKREEHPGADGETHWYSTTKAPISDNNGRVVGLVGVSRDITRRFLAEQALQRAHDDLEKIVEARTRSLKQEIAERKRAEAELIKAKEAAEAASQAKTTFLANMSHELRTPLNAIIGFSDIMRSQLFGDISPKYTEYAENIYDSGCHLLRIITDILDVSRIEAGKIRLNEAPVDIGNVVASAWRQVEHLAEEGGLHFTAELPEAMPRVLGDERLIKQAVLNLLTNAVKFTPEGGRLGVRVEPQADGDLAIHVSDTGIGIAEEHLDRVVRPFGQVDTSMTRKHDGTGLGLPLTKKFVELHGGRFALASRLGEGTTATILLPAARLLADAEAPAPGGG